MSDNKYTDCGAVFVRKSQKGETFLSLKVKVDNKDVMLVGFKNKDKDPKNKEHEKRPDYRLYLSKPLDKKAAPKPAPKQEEEPAEPIL